MRKIAKIFGLTFLVILNNMKAQEGINFGDFQKPVPSISSLSTYMKNPTSVASGVPEISIPLAHLPTADSRINMSVGLGYHPANVNSYEPAGETGLGWSLFAGGVISREIVGDLDEIYDNPSSSDYKKNAFDDIYYYNVGGGTGKFRFKRNIDNNTFQVENLSSNNFKIEFTRENNNATLIIKSFTLTDELGYKYYFNDNSIATNSYSHSQYKSAFFLSKLTKPDNTELSNLTYRKDQKETPATGFTIKTVTCKLKTIETSLGIISIDYNYVEQTDQYSMNDPYSISAIYLKNKNGEVKEKNTFEYNYMPFANEEYYFVDMFKRILTAIKKTYNNTTNPEETTFVYSGNSTTDYRPNPEVPFGEYLCSDKPDNRNPAFNTYGILGKIIFPTKGSIEYDYEAHELYSDKNSQYQLSILEQVDVFDPMRQYIKSKSTTSFDTNIQKDFPFTANGSKLYIQFEVEHLYTNGEMPGGQDPITGNENENFLHYTITSDANGKTLDFVTHCGTNPNVKTASLDAGSYTLHIKGTGGRGAFSFFEVKTIPPPYKNAEIIGVKGVRIKKITVKDNAIYDTNPKVTEYTYNEFDNPLNAAGFRFYSENNGDVKTYHPAVILYKNVKVKESNSGYTKYYFKLPYDWISDQELKFTPFYSLIKNGVLEKKEVYNVYNQIVASKTFDYTFENVPDSPEYKIDLIYKTKPAWTQREKIVERLYEAGTQNFVESSTESLFNPHNFRLSSLKIINADHTIKEQAIKYAFEKNNAVLLNANMLNIPLETESKYNGKTVRKSETIFSTNPPRPLSQTVINPLDNSTKTSVRYDVYDTNGNLIQYTENPDGTAGNPVTIIYGYNQSLPIAKIQGATINDISSMVSDIVTKSDLDKDEASEKTFINALDAFRTNSSLKKYQITTYTYDTLVGITSVTPPSGIREIYKYDDNNKLKSVVDVNGNIIKDYRYNVKKNF
ncbi:hypothetical protein ODZ84_01135 [Chryseobacterium fluminis]|uniref:hypothetical protein n=1 Tax=Chryseobacterium fluminis TaxID=2983606 RepID=UPI00224EF86C|nr:hypothetical protein [Chryseobacterium sp. MMS21-Ot14]UZT98206.1 hypothetical protein ODZ84_01135 [Chryseobacterium sp. MMS21-Ot14]